MPRPDRDEETANLAQRLTASGDFTHASALAFLVFILLYFPCIATVAAIGSEVGWRWAVASVAYNTLLAWLAAWARLSFGHVALIWDGRIIRYGRSERRSRCCSHGGSGASSGGAGAADARRAQCALPAQSGARNDKRR